MPYIWQNVSAKASSRSTSFPISEDCPIIAAHTWYSGSSGTPELRMTSFLPVTLRQGFPEVESDERSDWKDVIIHGRGNYYDWETDRHLSSHRGDRIRTLWYNLPSKAYPDRPCDCPQNATHTSGSRRN